MYVCDPYLCSRLFSSYNCIIWLSLNAYMKYSTYSFYAYKIHIIIDILFNLRLFKLIINQIYCNQY
jgi:hypothetical protein